LTIANDIMTDKSEAHKLPAPKETLAKTQKKKASVIINEPNWIETDVPQPPDLIDHVLHDLPMEEIIGLVSHQMLLGKHLGIKGLRAKLKDKDDSLIKETLEHVNLVISDGFTAGVLHPKAIYKWFKAEAVGEMIQVWDEKNRHTAKFHFPRQKSGSQISAIDWIRPADLGGDHLGMFVTTAGGDSAHLAKEWRDSGRLRDAHILQAVAIELAEATAEWLHIQMRRDWGIADPPNVDKDWLFKTNYHGIRLSFGYPAWPIIEDQEPLFDVMKPERIGVTLTEGMMMYPESSVSAVVFHHPDGTYYAV